MVILKSKSQVRSFIKRQSAAHRKHTSCINKFSDDPDDPNGSGIFTSIVVDKNKVLLKSVNWISGGPNYTIWKVIAIIKIFSK
jgi:hypothetical protein